ncbi:MAG: SPOR domain-containing protein [Betaproteobacteria bacterium]|nr:SPOR domain-containing protein [Betaproteobacteria bacterium]MDH3437617.1 SPOR domain-containing protein [Betaproteobacteria bacterium]
MRALFLLLILANLLFFAYVHVAGEGASVESRIAALQISPERIRLLRAGGGPAAEAAKRVGQSIPPVLASNAPSVCLEWRNLGGPDVARAENALGELGIEPARIARVVTDTHGYWVHMPPLENKAEVDRRIGELKALGVHEFFVVQETGEWRNAISLGIFRSDEAANVFLASLRQRGVRSAVMSRRDKMLKQVVFYVREPSDALVAKLAEIQSNYPGTGMKATPCPPSAEAER